MFGSLLQMASLLLLSIIGGSSTFLICRHSKLNKVQASALPTFLFSLGIFLYLKIVPNTAGLDAYPTVFFGSTFIGMTSNKIATLANIIVATLIYGLLYIVTENAFHSYGGKLGLMACIAMIISFGLQWGWENIGFKIKRIIK